MDLVQATGPGGIGFAVIGSNTSGAALVGDGLVRDSNKAAAAHGILYAVVALGVAPVDSLVARTLGRRLPGLHAFTASLYFAFVIGAMIPGILTSREQVEVWAAHLIFSLPCMLGAIDEPVLIPYLTY